MSENYTIREDFTLPSLGKVYDKPVNPNVSLRSMTTEEEMRRLAHSERPYKVLCGIIDDCMVGEKPGISTYDMCLGDYQYLLHRLRVVTYGSDYTIDTYCPFCDTINKQKMNLDDLKVNTYTDEIEQYFNITLPKTGKILKLRVQTPRSVDDITIKKKDFIKKNPEVESDPGLLLTLKSLVETVDGELLDPVKLDRILRKLPMADTNYILKCAEKLTSMIGVSTEFDCTCKECGGEYRSSFRITPEFFGPTLDE